MPGNPDSFAKALSLNPADSIANLSCVLRLHCLSLAKPSLSLCYVASFPFLLWPPSVRSLYSTSPGLPSHEVQLGSAPNGPALCPLPTAHLHPDPVYQSCPQQPGLCFSLRLPLSCIRNNSNTVSTACNTFPSLGWLIVTLYPSNSSFRETFSDHPSQGSPSWHSPPSALAHSIL